MNKTILTLLRDKWLILPSYGLGQQMVVNNFLAGRDVKMPTSQQVIYEARRPQQEASTGNGNNKNGNKEVWVINILGPIFKYDVECGDPGAMTIARLINNANNNPDVAGVVLNIDSPGGASTGATLLADTIKSFKKPIIASISHGYAASAAYWIASQCDEIYLASPQDSVGSIGAYCVLVDDSEALEKQGYKVKTIYAPQSTQKNAEVRAALEQDDTSMIEQSLYELVELFKAEVRAGRGERLTSEESFTGQLYNLEQAMEQGLIDGQKTLDECILMVLDKSKPKHNNSNFKTQNMSKLTLSIATLAVALGWADGFESTEQGISLSIEEANALNDHLEQLNNSIQSHNDSTQALIQAQQRITELEASLSTAQGDVQKYKTMAETYGGMAATSGTQLPTAGDPPPPSKKEERAMDSTTAEAMRIYNLRNKK